MDKIIASVASLIFGFMLSAVLTADGILPLGNSGAGWSLILMGIGTIHLVLKK
tara:strand:- start:541 stop:699 length:159 start_codon:yes stop_codon:yes gene_type:complete